MYRLKAKNKLGLSCAKKNKLGLSYDNGVKGGLGVFRGGLEKVVRLG